MKIDRDYQLEHVMSNDETRFHLTHAHLDTEGERPMLVATNGHALAAVPVALEPGDDAGPVTGDVLKAARKIKATKRDQEIAIGANGCYKLADGSTLPRQSAKDAGQFPPWRHVVPKHRADQEGTVSICFNPSLLLDLAKALGAADGPVTLTFPAPDAATSDVGDPIVVTSDQPGREGAIGVLMPMRRDVIRKRLESMRKGSK